MIWNCWTNLLDDIYKMKIIKSVLAKTFRLPAKSGGFFMSNQTLLKKIQVNIKP